MLKSMRAEVYSLLDDESLHKSTVVANCNMNRERQLSGTNGYSFELRFDIFDWLMSFGNATPVRWLDVCCGTGTALIEAMEKFRLNSDSPQLYIEGIDLAGHFLHHQFAPNLYLYKTPFETWVQSYDYDLVTCIHGLHYIGDKLGAIQKMVNCLSPLGVFVANVDLANFRFTDGRSAGRTIAKRLRDQHVIYDSRSRSIKCFGGRRIDSFKLEYAGADDDAGPNFTGQSSVNSHYER